jgi:hypothetical protein
VRPAARFLSVIIPECTPILMLCRSASTYSGPFKGWTMPPLATPTPGTLQWRLGRVALLLSGFAGWHMFWCEANHTQTGVQSAKTRYSWTSADCMHSMPRSLQWHNSKSQQSLRSTCGVKLHVNQPGLLRWLSNSVAWFGSRTSQVQQYGSSCCGCWLCMISWLHVACSKHAASIQSVKQSSCYF